MKLSLFDILLIFNYLVVIYFLAIWYVKKKKKTRPEFKYFIPGLSLKIIGALGFAAIYVYYYGGGDTFLYYRGGNQMYEVFIDDFPTFVQLLFSSPGNFSPELISYTYNSPFFDTPEEFLMSKITGVLLIISFHSYWLVNVWCAVISFAGVWMLYRFFIASYPALYNYIAYAIFFIPSVFFWGSGLLKDSFTLAGIGVLIYAVNNILFKRRRLVLNIVLMVVSAYVILTLKAYIILAFVPAVIVWIYSKFRSELKSLWLRLVVTPLLIVVIGASGWMLLDNISDISASYKFENLIGKAKGFHSWHTYLTEEQGQSGYTLGEIDYTYAGIVKKIPASVNVTLFRPYLWEIDNIVMFLAALESLALTFFTLYVIVKRKLYFFKALYSNPEVALSMFFTLIFAFSVGFTSYNFGALVRYKIPCIPFFVIGLIIILYKGGEKTGDMRSLAQ